MKGIMLVQSGAEEVACQEVLEILPKSKPHFGRNLVHFEAKDRLEFALLAYRTLCGIRVIEVVQSLQAQEIEEVKVDPSLFAPFFSESITWAVRCKSDESALLLRQELEQEIGEQIHDGAALKFNAKVDLSHPKLLILALTVGKDIHVGIDYAGVDLIRREYKIFSSGNSLSGGTAAAFIRLCGFDKDAVTLDCFSHEGTIGIEMAMQVAHMPPLFYKKDQLQFKHLPFFTDDITQKVDDEIGSGLGKGKITAFGELLRHLNTTKKNAKIAGVEKYLDISKVSVFDLDLKCKEKMVDQILCAPPNTSFELTDKKLVAIYEQMFYQADYVLTKKGSVGTIGGKRELLLNAAEKHNFVLKWEKTLFQGKLPLQVLFFVRK